VCVCVCVCVRAWVHTCVFYSCEHFNAHACVCVCVCACVSMCVCGHVCLHLHSLWACMRFVHIIHCGPVCAVRSFVKPIV